MEQAGSPTIAARCTTASAPRIASLNTPGWRTSPCTKRNSGEPQNPSSDSPPYTSRSSTVTFIPAANKRPETIAPTWPAPPVTTTFITLFQSPIRGDAYHNRAGRDILYYDRSRAHHGALADAASLPDHRASPNIGAFLDRDVAQHLASRSQCTEITDFSIMMHGTVHI